MNKLQVEISKLNKVADKVAVQNGFTKATIQVNQVEASVYLWLNDSCTDMTWCPATPKQVKQSMLNLVQRNSVV